MIMSLANSAPVITFSVPTLKVTPVPVRGSLVGMRGDTAGQLSPLPLPRPPRCLTPYPDTSQFPISNSLEPSPLSSPAFSAYSMSSSKGNNDDNEGDDISDLEAVRVDAKQEFTSKDSEIMSPTSRARADHARLLASALHMSHMNSPTDQDFRQLPLSPMPMRKLKINAQADSAVSSTMSSPVYDSLHSGIDADIEGNESKPTIQLTRASPPCTSRTVEVWLESQQHSQEKRVIEGTQRGNGDQESVNAAGIVMSGVEKQVDSLKVVSSQVLEVHVETVD